MPKAGAAAELRLLLGAERLDLGEYAEQLLDGGVRHEPRRVPASETPATFTQRLDSSHSCMNHTHICTPRRCLDRNTQKEPRGVPGGTWNAVETGGRHAGDTRENDGDQWSPVGVHVESSEIVGSTMEIFRDHRKPLEILWTPPESLGGP
eukprot:gene12928-biopygen12932